MSEAKLPSLPPRAVGVVDAFLEAEGHLTAAMGALQRALVHLEEETPRTSMLIMHELNRLSLFRQELEILRKAVDP